MIAANQNKQPAITSNNHMMIQENGFNNMLSLMTGENSTDLNTLNEKNQDTPL